MRAAVIVSILLTVIGAWIAIAVTIGCLDGFCR